ncbi:MAG: hypothetical protein ACTSPS_17090, partial [Promethearchaeota archaeon]
MKHGDMEYKETIRAGMDKLIADIYQLTSQKAYMIKICDIKKKKKKIIVKKLCLEQNDYDYQMLKDDIREHFFNEAYQISHPL